MTAKRSFSLFLRFLRTGDGDLNVFGSETSLSGSARFGRNDLFYGFILNIRGSVH
jgi:hypothetical protein